jgi:multidrug efflux system outer membrane protein
MSETRLHRSLLAAAIGALLLAGCTVGPRYARPEPDLPAQFDQVAGYADEVAPSQVWSAFREPELDALIGRALAANTDIAAAAARMEENRAIRGLIPFAWFPTITAEADAERQGTSNQDPFLPPGQGVLETWRAGFDASWEIDLFGRLRSESRAVRREVEASEAALADVRLSIVAETAQAYFSLRGAQQRLRVQRRNLENLQETDRILEALLREGRGSAVELAQNRALALQVAAQVPQVEAEIVRHEQRLAVLTAQTAVQVRAQLAPERALPDLPPLVAVGTPQEWLQRRPDVRAAERRAAAASARVGVAVADFFPQLTLLGSFGWTAQSASGLGNGDAGRWSYGPSLSWSFLNFGRVRQQVKAADARADAAMAEYEGTLLRALEETENALAAYRANGQSLEALQRARDNARQARDLVKLRYDNGATDYFGLLDAERTLLDAEDRLAQAQTQRATALAALYKALAGDFAAAAPAEPAAAPPPPPGA